MKYKENDTTCPELSSFVKDNCAALYETFLIALGKEFTEPVGAPNVTPFQLVDMYTNAQNI